MNSEKLLEVVGPLVLWAAFFAVAYYMATSPILKRHEMPVYYKYCSGYPLKKPIQCPAEDISLSKIVYKASFDNQVVIEKLGLLPPKKLENCNVYDVKNWTCGDKMMNNGSYNEYYDDTNEYWSDYFQPISRFRYTFMRAFY